MYRVAIFDCGHTIEREIVASSICERAAPARKLARARPFPLCSDDRRLLAAQTSLR